MLGMNGDVSGSGVFGSQGISITSATETFTCPGGAVNTVGASITKGCYVQLASSHATFNISANITGTGTYFALVMIAEEIQGLGTFDAGSATNVTGSSMTTPTANANEYIWSYCSDYSFGLTPGSGLSQNTMSSGNYNGQNAMGLTSYQMAGAAGNYTTGCTSSGASLTALMIVALAFQQSSPPTVPSVATLQACHFNTFIGGGSDGGGCTLANVQSGNKVIVAIITKGITLYSMLDGSIATEALTIPSGTFNTTTYNGTTYGGAVGYVDLASNHSSFNASMQFLVCHGCTAPGYYAIEVTGLNSGADTGSAAWCAATTCNYTTLTSNEFTAMLTGNNVQAQASPGVTTLPYQMFPGNGFLPLLFSYMSTPPVLSEPGQYMGATKITVSSGANTGSFSQSVSNAPIITMLSFGVVSAPVTLSKRKSYIL